VFAGVHISATNIIDVLVYMGAALALGLWGWLMHKSDSIWRPVLIHAGVDVLAILGFIVGAFH
jgi:membrane protease YdiL (CAAX protease family)